MKELLFQLLETHLRTPVIDEGDYLVDLGADNLDMIEILVELEARLGVSLDEKDFSILHSVGEWLEKLERIV